MKKLSDDEHELRDILFSIFYDIPYTERDDYKFFSIPIVRPSTNHNYDRQRELDLGKYGIYVHDKYLGMVQRKPHKIATIKKQYNPLRFYQSLFERVCSDYIAGISIEIK